jgi:NADH dehydrogenase (ubiquinone) 1 alpha subcomplex subunit 6
LRHIAPGSARYDSLQRALLATSCAEGAADTAFLLFQAPEIQTMYHVPQPVSFIRSRMRQEFERNRFVNKLPIVDVLLFKSNADYQVSMPTCGLRGGGRARGRSGRRLLPGWPNSAVSPRLEYMGLILGVLQETMNFWRQTNHVMSYLREEQAEKRLPSNFITGFLEVRRPPADFRSIDTDARHTRVATRLRRRALLVTMYIKQIKNPTRTQRVYTSRP